MSVELSPMLERHERSSVEGLLSEYGFVSESCSFSPLTGDGSDRRFIRVTSARESLIVILPVLHKGEGKSEARSGWLIGRHLQKTGVPVPEMIAYDPETGVIVCEDLGQILLHRHVTECGHGNELPELYKEAVGLLVRMQINGHQGFTPDMCWDNPVYDRRTMLERESGYFFDSCCRKKMGIKTIPKELDAEFLTLAELAGEQSTDFFLHRDFQSRNIMIKDGRLRVIDFQGGRSGPLAYDLASLLIDPYVQLSAQVRDQLLDYYLDQACELIALDRAEFIEGYYWLAIQRNLQILGAFSFLSAEKGKPFFRGYLKPAAACLLQILDGSAGVKFPILKTLVQEFKDQLNE